MIKLKNTPTSESINYYDDIHRYKRVQTLSDLNTDANYEN